METPTDRQRVDDNPRTRHEFTRKYGGLFASDITFRERLEQVRADLPNRFVDYPDDHFLGKDVKTLTKDFMFRFMEHDPTPNLELNGSDPMQETSHPDFVVVRYFIPVDNNTEVLNFDLPRSLQMPDLSEYARIIPRSGFVGNPNSVDDVKYLLDIEYRFPVEVWQSRVRGQLKQHLDKDVDWLRSVIEDFDCAFEDHTKKTTELIHIETLNRWQFAMDVAGEVASAPLPEEDADGTLSR